MPKEAFAYGRRVARERGDSESVDSIGEYANIQVHIPQAVRLQIPK